jgi:hypothetical protein
MKGVSYITDEKNNRTAVIIDLHKYGELWEDFYDYLTASRRKNEPKTSLDAVIKKLKKSGKLKADV